MDEKKRKRASGAGVKPDDGAAQPLERKQVRLDADSERVLLAVGAGNLSLGIREAARRLAEIDDIEPFSIERHNKRRKQFLRSC